MYCIGLFPKKLFENIKPAGADEKKASKTTVKTRKTDSDSIESSAITNKGNALKFNAPTFLSIGCDYVFSSRAKASKANFFISGTFSF